MIREDKYRKRMLLGQDGNSLMLLIAILAIVFCIFKFIEVVFFFSGSGAGAYRTAVFDWFVLPASPHNIASRPWTILTYMFMHDGVWHLLGNLLWLWAFGYILQDLTGNGRVIPLFIYGGLAGALFFVLTYNIVPRLAVVAPVATIEGGSAGVMAIAIATTTLAPNYRIFPMVFGGIPLWVLTIVFIIIDFASIPVSNTGGHVAHLAGALVGFLFIVQLRKGRDGSIWMNNFFDWVNNLFNPEKKSWKRTAREDLNYRSNGTEPYRKIPKVTQKRIDEILDKINQKGVRHLTEEEKEILKRASEEE